MATTVAIHEVTRDQGRGSRLADVVLKDFTDLQILDGQRFRGQLLDIADTTRVTNFHSSRRLLRVRPNSPVRVADLIQTDTAQIFLCASHGDGFVGKMVYRYFKLYEMDSTAMWQRRITSEDIVTGLERSDELTDMGIIYFALEQAGTISDKLHISTGKYSVITNADLQPSDIIGDYNVLRSDKLLGVTIAEVS